MDPTVVTLGAANTDNLDVTKLSKDDLKRLIGQGSTRVTYALKESTRLKSEVWKKFVSIIVDGKPAPFVKCKDCPEVYRSTGKSGTSTLMTHVCASDVTGLRCKSGPSTPSVASSSKGKQNHQTIDKYIHKTVPNQYVEELNEVIVTGLARDLRPLRTVEGEGFMQIAQALISFGAVHGNQDAKTVIRHRTSLKTKYLPKVVKKLENRLVEQLKTTSSYQKLAFTTAMWSEKYQQRDFLSLTVHFINDNWKLKSHMLGVEEFDSNLKKTTDNVRDLVHAIVGKYIDPSDVAGIMSDSFGVTDGGSNMISVFRQRLPCMCHRLNLVMQWTFNQKPIPTPETVAEKNVKGKPLNPKKLFNLQTSCPSVKDVLTEIKSLVEFFKRSGQNKNLKTTLKQDAETRWNSQLRTLQSYAASKEQIADILYRQKKLEKKAKINDDVVDQLIDFLKPFKECSDILSGETFPTFHLVALWYHKLLKHIQTNAEDSLEMSLLKEQANKCFEEYWNLESIHYAACMLDPRYKKLKFAPESMRANAIDFLQDKLTEKELEVSILELQNPRLQIPEMSTSTAADPVPYKKARFRELEDSDEVEISEMERYLSYKLPNRSEASFNILEFWASETASTQFPNLQQIAKWLLAIPASQASDERVFSSTGGTLGPRRTLLNGSTLSQLTLIHKNSKW